MNPDEQNNNPAINSNPVAEPTPMDGGAAPLGDVPAMDAPAAADVLADAPVDLNVPATDAAPVAADPISMSEPAASAPVEPTADPLAGMGEVAAAPADTTFTPVTAGEAAPVAPAMPVEPVTVTGEAPAPGVADPAAPVNPANPANPAAAPMIGAPAPGSKMKLTKNTIILIAVAGAVLIGVVVLLIVANIK